MARRGRTSAGPLSFAFETVREIELKPFYEIRARLLRGSMRKLEGTTRGTDRDSNRESRGIRDGYVGAPGR